jgi:hypothetical protein
MSVEMIEVFQVRNLTGTQEYSLRKVYINPEHVVCMRHDDLCSQRLNEGLLPEDLDSRTAFTKLYINRGQFGLDVTVVGDPASIQRTIDESIAKQKVLLKG